MRRRSGQAIRRQAIIMPSLHGKTTLAERGHPYYDVDDARDPATEARLKTLRRAGKWTEHNRIWDTQVAEWIHGLPADAIILIHHPSTLPFGVDVLGAVDLLDDDELLRRFKKRSGITGDLSAEERATFRLLRQNRDDVRRLNLNPISIKLPGVSDD